jgi:hypothetical protein
VSDCDCTARVLIFPSEEENKALFLFLGLYKLNRRRFNLHNDCTCWVIDKNRSNFVNISHVIHFVKAIH